MKKLFSIFMLTAMVFCFSSCGSDNDDAAPEKAVYASVDANYSLEFSDQLLDMSVITVKYTNEKGETASEAVNAKTWSKKVKVNKPASELLLQVCLAKKDGADYSENSPYVKTGVNGGKYFSFSVSGGSISATTYDSKGNKISMYSRDFDTNPLSVALDKFDILFSKDKFRERVLNISDDGKEIF